jgi:hypothetical protein
MIPDHATCLSDIDRVVQDETKTPLVVNRTLYRAHREFRHTLTEACKRFEDEQVRRAKESLRAQEGAGAKYTADLVTKHGQALSDESCEMFFAETIEQQQKQVDQANRRGGRGRHSRKKTTSDMSGMLGGRTPPVTPEMGDREKPSKQEALAPIEEDNDTILRGPTVPGDFRVSTWDPFQYDSGLRSSLQGGQDSALPEISEDDEDNATAFSSFVLEEPSPHLDSMLTELSPNFPAGSPGRSSSTIDTGYSSLSAPPTPLHYGKRFDEMDDSPLQYSENKMTKLTPPQSPVRGPSDYVTPSFGRESLHPK